MLKPLAILLLFWIAILTMNEEESEVSNMKTFGEKLKQAMQK